jgi:hypothetical protein
MRARFRRGPARAPRPNLTRPVLARHPDLASSKAAAAPPAVALSLADTTGHGAELGHGAAASIARADRRPPPVHAWSSSGGVVAKRDRPWRLQLRDVQLAHRSFDRADRLAVDACALVASCRTAIVASGRSCFCNSPLIRLHPRTIAIMAKRSSGCDTSARLLSRQRDRELGAVGMSKADVSGRAICDARGPQDVTSGSLLADHRFIARLIGGMVVE